uniref:NHL domain-containing protein n=1 Tax=Microbulbifer agarilyticus TaxID=260552 RepID=UPI0002559A5E|nr:RHS repeat-associated core domain-containing protein [Microbulbifer agarilyticus]
MFLKRMLGACRFLICASVVVLSNSVKGGEFPVSGVQEFIRETGNPVEHSVNFSAPKAGDHYRLRILNVEGEGYQAVYPVTSGIIALNGSQRFLPDDFTKKLNYLEVPVSLELQNFLTVKLAGKPGSGLRAEVVGVDNDVPMIASSVSLSANEAGWHKEDVIVNFTCSDSGSGVESCSAPVVIAEEGANQVVTGVALDMAGNSVQAQVTVNLDKTAPIIEVVKPADGAVMDAGVSEVLLNFSDNLKFNAASLELLVDGKNTACTVNVGEAVCQLAVEPVPGQEVVLLASVSDLAGNTAAVESRFSIEEDANDPSEELPLEPDELATSIDKTSVNSLRSTTEFIFSGLNPIQTGVLPETIEEKRAAVIRGEVFDKANSPLSGVSITIKDHPEFGRTLTRANGKFDMAVNGGGHLVVNYEKEGFLPAQRLVKAPWNDYIFAKDVVLIPLDNKVTTIDLADSSMPFQVHQGSLQSDDDGSRQATVLFPAGVSAVMTLPGGGVASLDYLSVRATEYTVGENGSQTMPGPLPPISGYTYAVELSVDEAIAVGASRIDFSQALPVYVDNFLEFPVGSIVPAGWYDREKAAWIPSENGVVVEILDIVDGIAQLDIDGSGLAAGTTALTALGVSDAERRQLAELYSVGKSLWRVPTMHFTPWDHNWPYGPPMDAERPELPEPEVDEPEPEPECQSGSIIECQGQVLRERIPVVGTSFTLNYRSDRVSGRKAYTDIQLTEDTISPSLQQIILEVSVAGRKFEYTFPPQNNKSHRFIWDGVDAYGRKIVGQQSVNVRIGYEYDAVYYEPEDFERAFSTAGKSPITRSGGNAISARRTVTYWQQSTKMLQAASADNAGIGSWSLSNHHHYEISGQRIQRGNGSVVDISSLGGVIDTVAGGGEVGGTSILGDGGLAVDASLRYLGRVAVAPDGSFYFTDDHLIRKVDVDGYISTIAGTLASNVSVRGFSGDGAIATAATMDHPYGLDFCDDGSIYVADTGNDRVRRIDRRGVITTIAGSEVIDTFAGDGGPATDASLNAPYDVICGPHGSIYIADSRNHRIRRVDVNGIISTVAGSGARGFSGDGGPATDASLSAPSGITLDPEGNLYIVDSGNRRIRRVGVDGRITTIAGNGGYKNTGDGGSALEAGFDDPLGIAYAADGGIYISDSGEGGVRRIGTDGTIVTVAGNKSPYWGFGGDGGPAIQADMTGVTDVAIGPEGSLYLVDAYNFRIRKVSNPEALALQEHFVSSRDGTQLFQFDKTGRHLETRDAVSGALIYRFHYNEVGLLERIEDSANNETAIERGSNGVPLAIVAPDGQRTDIAQDAFGYLSSVANPAGDSYTMAYTDNGLLARFTDPNTNSSSMTYDDLGYLVTDINAEGGGWTLEKESRFPIQEFRMTSAEGRTTRYQVIPESVGGRRRVNIHPDGTETTTLFGTGGDVITIAPDGTETYRKRGPDPRFGMGAPVQENTFVTTPAGLEQVISSSRTAELADRADLLSHNSLGQTVTINGRTATAVYDASSRTWSSATPEGRQSTVVLNDKGRPVFRQSGGLAPLGLVYDSRGRLVHSIAGDGATQRTVGYSYGSDGLLESVTDSLLRTTSFSYDLAGRVTQQAYHDGRSVNFQYDPAGNLTAITPSGRNAHIFNYTKVNLEEGYIPPDLSGVETVTSYQYNKDKQLVLIERPDGRDISYGYNDGGRLASRTIARGSYGYAYNESTGQLSTITAPDGGTLSYSYDGFLPLSETWGGSITGSVSWTYDNNFWLIEECINTSNCVSFEYDDDGLLTYAGALSQTRHAQSGLLTNLELDSTTTEYAYNSFGELLSAETKFSGSRLASFRYQRDNLGRIDNKTEIQDGSTLSESYEYDTVGRLKAVTRNGETTSWQYDSNGNRTHENGQLIASYDEQDRLLTFKGNSYSYTANGELKSKSKGGVTTHFSYDELGNLVSLVLPGDIQVDYLIDGSDRRVGKKVNGQLVQSFLYGDQLNPIAELSGSGDEVARFIYGEQVNVPAYMVKGGVTYRIVSDQLGSPRLVVNAANGEVAQRIDYDAWGRIIADTNPGFQPFGFAGGIYDLHSQLTRFGNRDYDADVGRWTAKDPIGFLGGDFGLYGYANGDPVNNIDDDGLRPTTSRAPGNPFSRINRKNHKLQSQQQSLRDRLKNLERDAAQKKKFLDDAISELERRMHPMFPTKCVKRECPWDNLNSQSCDKTGQKVSPMRSAENGCKCVKEEADWSGPIGNNDIIVVR